MAELVFPGTVKIDAEHLESRAELATGTDSPVPRPSWRP